MRYHDVIFHKFKHLKLREYNNIGQNHFHFKKLKTFTISIYQNQKIHFMSPNQQDYTTYISVERGAKRLYGYLEMILGEKDHHCWILYHDQLEMDSLFKLLTDIDNGIDYVYGKE